MEFPSSGPKPLTIEEFDTTQHLAHAAKQARERGFDKITHRRCRHASRRDRQLPPDGQLHRLDRWSGRRRAPVTNEGRRPMMPLNISYAGQRRPDAALRRAQARADARQRAPRHHAHPPLDGRRWARPSACSIRPTCHAACDPAQAGLGILRSTLAYNRWLANDLLPQEPQLKGMLYLPLHHAADCAGDDRGARRQARRRRLRGRVAALREGAVEGHDEGVLPPWRSAASCSRFHGMANWEEPALNAINRWGAVQAIGVPHSNMTHMTNWLITGMPERFPKLKVLWLESGIAWAHYLDAAARQHVHDARLRGAAAEGEAEPLHARACSTARSRWNSRKTRQALEVAFRAINAETQLVWGSNFPSHEFRRAGDDLGPAVPVRERQEGDPRRQRHEAVRIQARECMMSALEDAVVSRCHAPETKARIGLIIPSSNRMTEPQFNRYLPAGVGVHVGARADDRPPQEADRAAARRGRPRRLRARRRASAIRSCSIAPARRWPKAPRARPRWSRAPPRRAARSASRSRRRSSRRCKAHEHAPHRAVLALSAGHQRSREGILRRARHRGGARTWRSICASSDDYIRVPVTKWIELARENAQVPADGFFLSCTNTTQIEAIETIERETGKPAVNSNQAVLWACLKRIPALGGMPRIPGLGRLFAQERARAA